MKLSEAIQNYRPKTEQSRPLDNRVIKTYMKKQIRAKVEALLGKSWDTIAVDYRDEWLISGNPKNGSITLILRDSTVCFGFGALEKPELRIGFLQKELFIQG